MRFIIYAQPFSESDGGNIVMHRLCEALNERGYEAKVWPGAPYYPASYRRLRSVARAVKLKVLDLTTPYETGPFANPVARRKDLDGAVVVYNEGVNGNPLRSPRVVRWLLYTPGFWRPEVRFGADDFAFYFHERFNDPPLAAPENRLHLVWINPVYRQTNFGPREGSAFLLRKGRDRAFVHPPDAIPLDGLSHEDSAAVLNRVRTLYSYDAYTMLNPFAAFCGAVPIVVPLPGLTREAWLPIEEDRWGLAYGEEDVDWAVATRAQLVRGRHAREEEEGEMLDHFVAACRAKWPA